MKICIISQIFGNFCGQFVYKNNAFFPVTVKFMENLRKKREVTDISTCKSFENMVKY